MRFSFAFPTIMALVAGVSPAIAQGNLASDIAPQLGGAFKVFTQTIFPSSDHHLSDRLAFPELYQYKQRLSARQGIDFAILSAPVFQAGSGGEPNYFDNELDVLFSWRLIENERTTGRIFFYGIWVETFSELTTGAFAKSQGVLTLPNSGGTDPDRRFVSPSALWWEQDFSESGLRYRVGQLWSTNLWATNDFYGDDRATYMNSLLGGGAGVPWIGGNRGLGAMVSFERPGGYLSFGFQDSKADQQSIDFNSFSDGKFSYLSEIGLHNTSGGRRTGTYKLTLGYVDANGEGGPNAQPAGYGVNLSGQQELNDDFAVYGFYRRSWDRFAANVEQAVAVGVTATRPLGWDDDNASLAAFFSRPADDQNGTLRDEWGFETFWRFQLTPRLDLTPSAVVYLRSGRVSQDNPVAVLGLRLRYIL